MDVMLDPSGGDSDAKRLGRGVLIRTFEKNP